MRPIGVLRGISLYTPEHTNESSMPLTGMNTKIYLFLQQKSINFKVPNCPAGISEADFER